MGEFSSYTLDDFLLFSPRVYFRMLEQHNQALWPLQVLTIAAGLALIVMVLSPSHDRNRLSFAICGVVWLWVAWSFFFERYASINWAAAYVAPLAALEGALLLWFGARGGAGGVRPGISWPAWLGVGLLVFAVLGYPLVALVEGRTAQSSEVFGLTPEPTAIATLALLAVTMGRWRLVLMIIPLLWCALAGVTLFALQAPAWFVAPVCAAIAVLVAILGSPTKRAT